MILRNNQEIKISQESSLIFEEHNYIAREYTFEKIKLGLLCRFDVLDKKNYRRKFRFEYYAIKLSLSTYKELVRKYIFEFKIVEGDEVLKSNHFSALKQNIKKRNS